jgi:peptide/nickel transport system substrate-binding protein
LLRESELTEQLIVEHRERLQAEAAEQSVNEDEDITSTSTESIVTDIPEVTSSTVRAEVEQILSGIIDPSQTTYRQKGDVILDLDLVTVDTQEYRDAAALIEAAWQEIGITVNVAYVPAKDIARTVLEDRSYDVLLYGIIMGADPDQFPFWHSSQIDPPGLNLSGYNNDTVDTLLESARSETNEDTLVELYGKFQEEILADRPAVFLYMPIYTYVQTTDLSGFHTERIYIPSDRLNGVTSWYLKTKGVWKRNTTS